MKVKLGLATIAALMMAALTGCAPTINVPAAADATSVGCAGVIARLPESVSTLDQRNTNEQGTSAWGPRGDITLRCGVAVPSPTSTLVCVTVDGVDWLRNDAKAPTYVFTTYGRNPAVAVYVDSSNVNADGNSALTDLQSAVSSIKATHHCLSPAQVLRGGQPVETPRPTPTSAPTPTSPPTPTATPKP